jgi:hypothetical protein
LTNENKILKEKSMPELFKELNKKFYDQPRIVDTKRLQKDTGYVSLFYFVKSGTAKSL